MKKIFCVILALGLVALCGCGNDKKDGSSAVSTVPTVAPTATAAPQMAKIVTVNSDVEDGLNIRSDATSDSGILGLAEPGEKFVLMVEEQKNGWYQIKYSSGGKAFLYSEYVTVGEITMEEAALLNNASSGTTPSPSSGAAKATATPAATSAPEGSSEGISSNPEDGER